MKGKPACRQAGGKTGKNGKRKQQNQNQETSFVLPCVRVVFDNLEIFVL
jgi:hypothetical protein